jgi:hypothetical protein
VRLGVDDRLGRTLATKPDSLVALNWSDLYLNLRKQVPHEVYHAGRRVVALEAGEGEQPRLRLEDGAKEDFDLAIFADGYNSLGRRYVSPETKQTYRGYVLWRGAPDRRRLSDGGRALELAKALDDADDVDEALARWSAKETELGRRLLSVGERLEQLLIWGVPDLAAIGADSLQRWLDEIRIIQSEAFQH